MAGRCHRQGHDQHGGVPEGAGPHPGDQARLCGLHHRRLPENDKSLWQHFLASILRVTVAFWLAFLTALRVGTAMGMSRVARGIFDPPIEFYRPLPPLA